MQIIKKFLLIFTVFCCSYNISFSQGKVSIVADGKLQTILEQHFLCNDLSKSISGYRLKLAVFNGSGSKQQAFELKDKISQLYSAINVYVIFEEPNFIVKCGDFLTKLDCYKLYSELKQTVPTTTIVKDFVDIETQLNIGQ